MQIRYFNTLRETVISIFQGILFFKAVLNLMYDFRKGISLNVLVCDYEVVDTEYIRFVKYGCSVSYRKKVKIAGSTFLLETVSEHLQARRARICDTERSEAACLLDMGFCHVDQGTSKL